jgi:predicted Zn-dependent protease
MSVTAPPRPPRPSDPVDREELEALVEALIEEARQRARRRRRIYADGSSEVYVVNADGSGQRNLSRTRLGNESSFAWSPGRK